VSTAGADRQPGRAGQDGQVGADVVAGDDVGLLQHGEDLVSELLQAWGVDDVAVTDAVDAFDLPGDRLG
jgi:hypothetical protein